MPTQKPKQNKIDTKTETRLRALAKWLTGQGFPAKAAQVTLWADELNQYDAREDRVKPSLRKTVPRR